MRGVLDDESWPPLGRDLKERQKVRPSTACARVPDASSRAGSIGGLDAPGKGIAAVASDTTLDARVCVPGVRAVSLTALLCHASAVRV